MAVTLEIKKGKRRDRISDVAAVAISASAKKCSVAEAKAIFTAAERRLAPRSLEQGAISIARDQRLALVITG